MRSAYGKVNGEDLVICCMDFSFIGGSMGSVVGEKIARSIDFCIKTKSTFIDYFKIGRSAYDGSCFLVNANG